VLGAELEMIGQQSDFSFVLAIPNHDPAEDIRAILPGIKTGKLDQLIKEDISRYGNGAFLRDSV